MMQYLCAPSAPVPGKEHYQTNNHELQRPIKNKD